MEAVMEPQVYVHGVKQREEMEVGEEALIRKRKSKDETPNGKSSEAVLIVQVEVEKDEEGEEAAKPMVYFDEEKRHNAFDRTAADLTSSNGYETRSVTAEEIVESMPIKDLVKESGPGIVDLERLLTEQNTHDLYCPNCNSCITRRVILRKRKRTVQVHPGDSKREKVADLPDAVNANLAEHSVDAEPELFGCLQCFSVFIRTATGYELLSKMFRGRDEDAFSSQELQNKDAVPARENNNTNCLAFFFEWGKGEPEGKSDATIDSQVSSDTTKNTNQKGIGVLEESGILHVEQPQWIVVAAGKGDPIIDSHVPKDVTEHDNWQGIVVLEKSEMLHLQHSHPIVVASGSNVEPVSNDNSLENDCMAFTTVTEPSGAREDTVATTREVYSLQQVSLSSDLGTLSLQSGKVLQEQSAPTLSKTGVLLQEDKDGLVISSETTNATSVVSDETASAMPVSSYETTVEIGPLIGNMPATNISTAERLHPAAGGWDILKAIVYGGLAESIASLGVTSSAAGGDASTLSIVALGLANLVGGLFVLVHNIFELKGNNVRYTETIGQPRKFWRNTIVVAVSYILFGLVAPITYGFSFRKSDNKDYKLMTVAIASLLCIIILALGKARVTDRFYIKKVIYFAALGVAVSGISYVVGIYVKKLLDQLGWISESQDTLYSPSLIMETLGRASQVWVS